MKHVTEVHFNVTTKHNQFFFYKIPHKQSCTTPVMLSAETMHIRNVFANHSPVKAEKLSKTVYLCVEIHYAASAVCKMCQKYKSKNPQEGGFKCNVDMKKKMATN